MARDIALRDAVLDWLTDENIDALYDVVKFCRESGKHGIGQLLCDAGRRYERDSNLRFEYEHSILAFYTKACIDHAAYTRLIPRFSNALTNYKYYARALSQLVPQREIHDYSETVERCQGSYVDTFHSSTPSIIKASGGYLMNVRYVNYAITHDGYYSFRHDGVKITSIYKTVLLDERFVVVNSRDIDVPVPTSPNVRYQGIEDVKLFEHGGDVLYFGTAQDPVTMNLTLGHGVYAGVSPLGCAPVCASTATICASPFGRSVEKNWCFAHDAAGALKVIYEFEPLTVCDLNGTDLSNVCVKTSESTGDALKLRGSTNGCTFGDEVWFVCHLADPYSRPYEYYHIIVVLDSATLTHKRRSTLFKFAGKPVEFCLGLVVLEDTVVMSYSEMDGSSKVMVVPRDGLQSALGF